MPRKVSELLKTPSLTAVAPGNAPPTKEEIAFRAHELFVERGGESGHELDDWLQAERELTAAARCVAANAPDKSSRALN